MKQGFMDYFKSLGMRRPYLDRTEELYRVADQISPAGIGDVFVSEYMDDGVRTPQSVWFFTTDLGYAIEAHFIDNDQIDIFTIKGRVKNIVVRKKDYDFKSATEKSRLNVRLKTDLDIEREMKASKENCDRLWHIVLTHLKNNLLYRPD